MMQSILVDAVYINQSGGKILLEYFIKELLLKKKIANFFFLFDQRLQSDCISQIPGHRKIKLKPGEIERLKFYKNRQKEFSSIFCFANVPPPIKQSNKKVTILFHNALILSSENMDYSFILRLKFFFKKEYIKFKNDKNYTWIVQTKNIGATLCDEFSISSNSVKVLPFFESGRFSKINEGFEFNNANFLYVADGVKQKNHNILLSAWELLFERYKLPINLHLTIPSGFTGLLTEVERLQSKGVGIINHGRCSFDDIKSLYIKCNTFISASLAESFGLPIIEATEAGCNVVSADLPYIHDIVKPSATFDPKDEKELAGKINEIYLGQIKTKTVLIVNNKINEIINLISQNA